MRNVFNPIQTAIVILSIMLTPIVPVPPAQANPIGTFLARFFKRNPTTIPGRRPGTPFESCELIPRLANDKFLKIWNRQPSFFTPKVIRYVKIRDSDLTNSLVLETPIFNFIKFSIDTQSIKPGKYNLSLSTEITVESSFIKIEIIDETERQRISRELAALNLKGLDQEVIALKQVEYFIDNDMAIDAIETLFKLDNPSSSIIEYKQQLVKKLCETGSNNSSTPAVLKTLVNR